MALDEHRRRSLVGARSARRVALFAALAALVTYAFDLDVCFIVCAVGSAAFGLEAFIEWAAAVGQAQRSAEPEEAVDPPELGLPLRRFELASGDEVFGTTFRCGAHVVTLLLPEQSAKHSRAAEEIVGSAPELERAFEAFVAREVVKFAASEVVVNELKQLYPSTILLDAVDPELAEVYLRPGDLYWCTLRRGEFMDLVPVPTVV